MREQIAKLTDELTQLKRATSYAQQQSSNASGKIAPTILPAEKTQAQMEEFNRFNMNPKDAMAAIKLSFANEQLDAEWAKTYAQELENYFKDSFSDVIPQYIECRSQRCRVTLPVSDQKHRVKLSQLLTQSIVHNERGIGKKIAIEPTTNDGTLNFYLARNNNVSFFQ